MVAEFAIGPFVAAVPIRCRGAIHFYSARDRQSGALRVIVMAPRIPVAEARERLGAMAAAHRLVAGLHVPDVVTDGLREAVPWVALDCDAVADQEHLADFVGQGGEKPHLKQASAVTKAAMESLIRCHGTKDPESGRSVCLGSVSSANLLFSADGDVWLVGFGLGPLSGAFVAPEVVLGQPPTPGADVYALMLFLRSQMGTIRLPSMLGRVFSARTIARDAQLAALIVWSNIQVLTKPPEKRPDMVVGLERVRKMWRLLGFEPDSAGFAIWVARALRAEPERLPDAATTQVTPAIVIGREARWLETPNGMRHALGARRPLRRLLLTLADARRERPGVAVTVDDLLQSGWPGENPLPEAGANRVYVAISTLRKLGLGELLERWDGGYRLDPTVVVSFKDL
jgi:hypothetical protein